MRTTATKTSVIATGERVTTGVAASLAKIDAMQGLPQAAQFEGGSAFYRRLDAFASAYKAAFTTADVCALVERLTANEPDQIAYALTQHDFAGLLVRVRDTIPRHVKQRLVAGLEALAKSTSGAVPLLIALAPERYGAVFTAFSPHENLSRWQNRLVSPGLTSALAALPSTFAEQARQTMIAGLNAAAANGDAGVTSAGAASRRSYELLLSRLAYADLQCLISEIDTGTPAEACSRIDGFLGKLFAGVTSGRGNPGFGRVVVVARILQKTLPSIFTGDDAVYIGGSFTNGKWREVDSDIDISLVDTIGKKVLHLTYDRWAGKDNAIADWLRGAETEVGRVLGVKRPEGGLISLAFPCGFEGDPQPGISHLGLTGYFAVRVTRNEVSLVVFNPDDPSGPPLYTRPL